MNNKTTCEIVEMNLPVVYGVINAEGQLIRANTRWVKMFDSVEPMWPEYQPNGQTTRDFIFKQMDEASKRGESSFEICANKTDKSIICIAANLQSEADGTFTVCAHDITCYKTSLEDAIKREQENEKKTLDLARRFLDAAPIFIEMWDNEMNLIGTNQVAVKMFGLRDTDHYIEAFDKLHPEFQPCGMKTTEKIPLVVEDVMKNGYAEGEWMHIDLDGNPVPVYAHYVRFDVGNNERYIVGYSHDLRPIRAALSELENALKLTRDLIDTAPFFVEIWNKNFELVDCSQVVVKTFEVSSKDEYINEFSKLSPVYQPCGNLSDVAIKETVKKTFKEGYARHEWMHLDKDGNLWPFDVVYVRIRRMDEDLVVAYASDLRPIKNAMDKLKASEERSIILLDASPTASFSYDMTHKTFDCNFAAVTLFVKEPGVHPTVTYPTCPNIEACSNECVQFQSCGRSLCPLRLLLIERNIEIFMAGHKEYDAMIAEVEEFLNEVVQKGTKKFEWVLKTLYGMSIPCEITIVNVNYDGNQGFAFYMRDLREEKLRVMAEDANKAKSSFLSTISHEIRTPLNAIIGITQIHLQKNSLSLEETEAFQKIYSSGSTLLGIINGMLDLSKIETGNLELMPVEYDVPNLINDSVQLNFVQLESKPVEFFLEIDENLPATLVGDDLRLKQILNNLLSNSVKYTQSGHIKFSIKYAGLGETCELSFIIEDTGQGISSEDLPKLFSAYTRFNLEENRTVEGTGIGLKITEELIKMMGGSINVESTVGVGSKFTVTIMQKTTGSRPIGKNLAKELENFSFANSKISTLVAYESMPYGSALIVDDVESNLYVAEGLLAPYNITIDMVESGYDALEKIKAGHEYDIIFMDHMMPKMDGIQTTKKLREMGYSGVIIALTANALKGNDVLFLKSGFDWFISKPIDVRQLDNAMTRFIRDKHLEKASRSEAVVPTINKATTSKIKIRTRLLNAVLRDVDKAIYAFKNFQKSSDMEQLIITAHSIKAALLNVNEQELSDIAASLEKAGRTRNSKYIDECLITFIQDLEKLASELSQNQDFPN